MPGKRLTIDDIARLAGVSKATISRVLNRKPDVDPATRERILRIVQEHGFVPSAAATGLAKGKSQLMGMLVRSYTWPFVLEIMRGVSDVIDDFAYELVLYRMNDEQTLFDRAQAIDRLLSTALTAGLLAVYPGQAAAFLAPWSKRGLRLVMIDDEYLLTKTPWEGEPVPWITVDSRTGAYQAVRHLIEHGHRRIAHIQGPNFFLCTIERYEGYCQALTEAGIPLDPSLIIEGDFTTASGHSAAHLIFSRPPEERPTAVFAASDLTAYGLLAVAPEYGISVPKDLAVIGFDDLFESSPLVRLSPFASSLTTVKQPFYEMGQYATEQLLSSLEIATAKALRPRNFPPQTPKVPFRGIYRETGGILRHLFPADLTIRTSCGCPEKNV